MQDINPHVRIQFHEEGLTSERALRILQGWFVDGRPYNVVVDGLDDFPTKYLFNDACHIVGVPLGIFSYFGRWRKVSCFQL
jgi:molybdopterin/thiamine biosynthesis adenylyltransferase